MEERRKKPVNYRSWPKSKTEFQKYVRKSSDIELIQFGYQVADQLCESEEGWGPIQIRCPFYKSLHELLVRRSKDKLNLDTSVLEHFHFTILYTIHMTLFAIIDYHDNRLTGIYNNCKIRSEGICRRLKKCRRRLGLHMTGHPYQTLIHRYVQRCDRIVGNLSKYLSK